MEKRGQAAAGCPLFLNVLAVCVAVPHEGGRAEALRELKLAVHR
jgi:hypothetical protein